MTRIIAALIVALLPASGWAAPVGEVAHVTRLVAGHYVRAGVDGEVFVVADIANIGFVVGERCVAVIDTGGSLAEGRALDAAIRNVTSVPVCYVINTHVHPDHVLGNEAFVRPGVQFVGHARLERALAMLGNIYLARAKEGQAGEPPSRLVPPVLIVPQSGDRKLVLDLGGRTLELHAHASAHTDQDVTVLDPDAGVLWAGDLLFVRHVPVIQTSVTGWIAELEGLMQRRFHCVVPGHGPAWVGWPQGGENNLSYLKTLATDVRAAIAAGESLESAMDSIGNVNDARWTLFAQYHRRNVSVAYSELEWE